MAQKTKLRGPYNPPADDEFVERLVRMPGWVYNLMAARGTAQGRTTKYQIAFELERLAHELKEQEPGQKLPTPAAA